MKTPKSIEIEKSKPVITLKQLQESTTICNSKNEPAPLLAIVTWAYDIKNRTAIEAAKSGDFEKIESLILEITVLVESSQNWITYLSQEKAIIKDPNGPEAHKKEVMELVNRSYRAKQIA